MKEAAGEAADSQRGHTSLMSVVCVRVGICALRAVLSDPLCNLYFGCGF